MRFAVLCVSILALLGLLVLVNANRLEQGFLDGSDGTLAVAQQQPATQPPAPTTEERAHARTKQLAELHPARYLRRSASSDGDNWAEFLSRILHKHPELKDAVPTLSGEYFDD